MARYTLYVTLAALALAPGYLGVRVLLTSLHPSGDNSMVNYFLLGVPLLVVALFILGFVAYDASRPSRRSH